MRLLVLGGTAFLSRAVAAAAVREGHEVVCAARGRSGSVPAGARLLPVDRDRGLDGLAGQRFDAVVDVATMSLRWVRDALAQLGATAGHWCFVSSVNVYADTRTRGQSPGAPLLEPAAEDPPAGAEAMPSAEVYGAVKVASENAVREAVGDRALIVRPGLICGPGDVWDRFGYWVMRFTRGGRVLVPDSPEQPIQYIDVRDLADWLVLAAEQRVTGTYDAVGPVTELRELLRGISAITSPPGTELAAVLPEELLAAGVTPWSGPKSLPLWAPESHWGLPSHDPGPAAAAGLRVRPVEDTVRAVRGTEQQLGFDRPRHAGLTAAEETGLLESLPWRLW